MKTFKALLIVLAIMAACLLAVYVTCKGGGERMLNDRNGVADNMDYAMSNVEEAIGNLEEITNQ